MKQLFTSLFSKLLFLAFLLLTGCAYNSEEELYSEQICDTIHVTYDSPVKGIISANCNSCHNSSAPEGGVILDNYNDLSLYAAAGLLVKVINYDPSVPPMPQGANQLPECSRAQIGKWVELGMPQ